jgi:hypothetical protein
MKAASLDDADSTQHKVPSGFNSEARTHVATEFFAAHLFHVGE